MRVSRLLSVSIFVCLSWTRLGAQKDTVPSFRAQSELVLVDLLVTLDFANLMEIPKQIPAPGEDNPEISALTGITLGLPEAPDWAFARGVPGGVEAGVPGGIVFADLPALPIPVGGKLQNSKLIHKVQPQYPETARLAGVEGIVLLQVLVSQDGVVSDIEILRGHPLLNEAAISAVRQWRYSPTLLNGSSIPTIATVTVNFVLQSAPAQEPS